MQEIINKRPMKCSGIEWIGETPESWNICRLKHCCEFINGFAFDSNDFNSEGNCNVVRIGDIEQGTVNITNAAKVSYDTTLLYKYLIRKNDILMALSGATVGKVGYIENEQSNAFINQRVAIIRSNISKLIYHWFQAGYISSKIDLLSNSSAQPNISTLTIGNLYITLPIHEEQQKIAEFLDEKCGHIDLVLEKTKASIEDYKKLKQSVITQAVTKGIRPNRQMKDSGIEWIGEIPFDWKVQRIKTLFNLRDERNTLPLEEVNLISLYTDIGVIQHSDIEASTGNKASNADGYKKVYEDDIVVNIILCWMGAIGRSAYNGVTSPAYDVYFPNTDVNSNYYHHYFRTTGFNGDCYKRGRGIMAMRWRTYSDQFRDIRVAVPSTEEQQEIVNYLDSKCAEIDKLIDKKEQLISELETYKKSLIYEYVTGKKEVV